MFRFLVLHVCEREYVHAFARTRPDPVARAVARSIGQGVTMGHMADHCIGEPLNAQKSAMLPEGLVSEDKSWHIGELCAELPDDITKLILGTMQVKRRGFGLPDDMGGTGVQETHPKYSQSSSPLSGSYQSLRKRVMLHPGSLSRVLSPGYCHVHLLPSQETTSMEQRT